MCVCVCVCVCVCGRVVEGIERGVVLMCACVEGGRGCIDMAAKG